MGIEELKIMKAWQISMASVGLGLCVLGAACSASSSADNEGGHGAVGASTGTGATGQGGFNIGGDGSGGGYSGCDPQTFTLQKGPASRVFLVIDRSGSMDWDGTTLGVSRWTELLGAVDTTLVEHDSSIDFGLLMYPSGDQCQVPAPQVMPGSGNHDAIMNVLQSAQPLGGTPTAAALQNAVGALQTGGDSDRPGFLVLATDGGPNCNASQGPIPCTCTYAQPTYCCTSHPLICENAVQCLDDQRTIDRIATYHAAGIDTFVIGLPGTDHYVALLDAMALAGGRPQQGGSSAYYAVNNPGELLAALQTITTSVISCRFELAEPPDYPNGVQVFLDGTLVPRDESKQNGWDFTDDTHTAIELYGSACETLQDGSNHNVTATFPCEVW